MTSNVTLASWFQGIQKSYILFKDIPCVLLNFWIDFFRFQKFFKASDSIVPADKTISTRVHKKIPLTEICHVEIRTVDYTLMERRAWLFPEVHFIAQGRSLKVTKNRGEKH